MTEATSVDDVVRSIIEEAPKKRRPRGFWKMFNPKMAEEFYEEHYAGMTRRQVQIVDGGFYDMIRRNGWVEKIIPKPGCSEWEDTTLEKARDYLRKNCSGMSRKEIADAEGGFYQFLRRRGWLDEVLPPKKFRDWTGVGKDDAKKFYEENYAGLGRSEVKLEDASFYYFIRNNGWLDEVFPEKKHRIGRDWSDFTPKIARKYYEENYAGMSRSQVNRTDSGFYKLLSKKGWLDEVLPERKFRDWSDITFKKAREFYEENFAGMIRKQVQEADQAFYKLLLDRDWVDDILPRCRYQDWSFLDTPEKAREYYEDNFAGMSSKAVYREDCAFAGYVQRKGWRAMVFPRETRAWSWLDSPDVAVSAYLSSIADTGRDNIKKFRLAIKRRGWSEEVWDNIHAIQSEETVKAIVEAPQ